MIVESRKQPHHHQSTADEDDLFPPGIVPFGRERRAIDLQDAERAQRQCHYQQWPIEIPKCSRKHQSVSPGWGVSSIVATGIGFASGALTAICGFASLAFLSKYAFK